MQKVDSPVSGICLLIPIFHKIMKAISKAKDPIKDIAKETSALWQKTTWFQICHIWSFFAKKPSMHIFKNLYDEGRLIHHTIKKVLVDIKEWVQLQSLFAILQRDFGLFIDMNSLLVFLFHSYLVVILGFITLHLIIDLKVFFLSHNKEVRQWNIINI